MTFVTFPSANKIKNETCNVSFKLYIYIYIYILLMNQHLLFLFGWVLQKNDQRKDNKP
jgi:hypothetical protein